MERRLSESLVTEFEAHLLEGEKSCATMEKYLRDVRHFVGFVKGKTVDKAMVIAYKAALLTRYAVTSANSMLASLNTFLRFAGWHDLCIRQFRVQRQAFVPEERELSRAEYERLVSTAEKSGNQRLNLILQTICATGIRVSELSYITTEALQRGEATVRCKGKARSVFIVRRLCRLLLDYAGRQGIESGPVFVTRSGRPVSRTAIWREMKALCQKAGVSPQKVFPHNLRHLFARTFYGMEKDIAKLADILGHSSINTTRIYIAATGAEHKQKMEHMRLVIAGSGCCAALQPESMPCSKIYSKK